MRHEFLRRASEEIGDAKTPEEQLAIVARYLRGAKDDEERDSLERMGSGAHTWAAFRDSD